MRRKTINVDSEREAETQVERLLDGRANVDGDLEVEVYVKGRLSHVVRKVEPKHGSNIP